MSLQCWLLISPKTEQNKLSVKQEQTWIRGIDPFLSYVAVFFLFYFFYFWCFNTTFSNISAISLRPILMVDEAGIPRE
jgi:hypothetical protein